MNGACCMFVFCLGLTLVYGDDADIQFPYRLTSSLSGPLRLKRNKGDESCKLYPYGTRPNVKHPGHRSNNTLGLTLPLVDSHTTRVSIGPSYNRHNVFVHVAYVNDPARTVSVYEPLHNGTCSHGNWQKATVLESARPRQCLLAVNAGFFDTSSGECYGNIVSDGHLVQDSKGLQNVHFGITKKGDLFFGYLSEIDLVAEDFVQLVGGVIWVLKDGKPYVDESIATECADVEQTGTLQKFASVISARTLIGHDSQGRVVVVQADGKTGQEGISLYQAAEMLQQFGLVNAMNFDGGGSSTVIINNTLASYPSDQCKGDSRFRCSRPVTTILCVHEPHCDPPDCGGHGVCDLGVCQCQGHWTGDKCDKLECPGMCSKHGTCTENGCVCFPGYYGDDCATPCLRGWYGEGCIHRCVCENSADCSAEDGSCTCGAGYQGTLCQYRCKLGYYGKNCSEACDCEDVATCDHRTGYCNNTDNETFQWDLCSASLLHRPQRVSGVLKEEYRTALITIIALSGIALVSLVVNSVMMYRYCSVRRRRYREKSYGRPHKQSNGHTFLFHGDDISSGSSSFDDDDDANVVPDGGGGIDGEKEEETALVSGHRTVKTNNVT